MKNKFIKPFLLITTLLLFFTTFGVENQYAQKARNFQGTWVWKNGDEEFELDLKQNGDKLTGYHFSIGQNGNKLDEADFAESPSIVGTINKNTAKVEFKSAFPDSSGKGTATLIFRNKQLYWKITKSSGEHYLPLSAVLKKKNDSAKEKEKTNQKNSTTGKCSDNSPLLLLSQ